MVEGGAEQLVLVMWGEGRGVGRRGRRLSRRVTWFSGTAGWYNNRRLGFGSHSRAVRISVTASEGCIIFGIKCVHISTNFTIAGAGVQC